MRYAGLMILVIAGLLEAQDGATIYKERCGSCHESPTGRVPSISTVKQMTPEAIYAALTNGTMKSQASGLSTQEVISLLVYIAPVGRTDAKPAFEKSCTTNVPLKSGTSAWGGWSPSVTNTRYQDAKAAGLTAAAVPRLKLKWAFNLGAVTAARGQPAVADGRVFTTTLAGDVYAGSRRGQRLRPLGLQSDGGGSIGCRRWGCQWGSRDLFRRSQRRDVCVESGVGRVAMEDAPREPPARAVYSNTSVL